MAGLQQLEFIGSCLSSVLPFSDLVCALLYPGTERLNMRCVYYYYYYTIDDRDDDNLVRPTGWSVTDTDISHSLPIQLYLVDSYTYAASAISAASVGLARVSAVRRLIDT
jgi:hypothetical protein